MAAVDRDLRVRVARVSEEANDVRAVWFTRTDNELFPAWDPGAHVDVVLPSGRTRQYSLNGDPDDLRTYRIAVRRIDETRGGGGGSAEVHALEVGQALTLKGPRNAFPFINSPHGYLFVAGGIGITPILPMLRDVARRGDPYVLIYTGRDRASMPFLDEIAEIAGHHDVHIWPDDEYGAPDAGKIIALAPTGAALYTCGPIPMIEAIRAQIPDPHIDTLHYERFSPPPVLGGEAFTVQLATSGVEVLVKSDESALTAIRRTKPGQAYSCQQGFCGTCKVRVLGGQVEHRDNVLTDDERADHMILCVSRAQGSIAIDA
ncbi:PDR/VanB family oxidoreductase [Mycobacterium sp. ITM-2016-00317]|uniref:PDR/VanB family oxidoreductase n=1 Tax=Mycobacterium sp. ITM-2016-00317 TaxID=2099694 RepID=UPI00287FEC82|nr:PDR/VanB family oxidoreductase [Mycobacterium sp. ITM-2016-00317]WNG88030.1 PDR/VanB family oxidoreductase [Mycobacterium sp. ITM-2016-00317]